MIDFHSHILPGIDDGSKNVEESLNLLQMLAEQGVTISIATPHFSANRESVDGFLNRRYNAFQKLSTLVSNPCPRIICGAEVGYYNGISRMNDLNKLCIGESKLLLLEMTMSKWTDYTVKELLEMSRRSDITVVIAHMERYMKFQSDRVIYKLYENGILMQFNASFFLNFLTKRQALNMLKNGEIHFIGSDCHNTTSRAPRIGKAFDVVKSKLGQDFIARFNEYGNAALEINH